MIIYYEKDTIDYELTKNILNKFNNSTQLSINNYKNIFDKNIDFPTQDNIILAKLRRDYIWEVPANYSKYSDAFFFKTGLNCVFDCKYCYLKWAFKNNFLVIFVNYNDIRNSIEEKIKEIRGNLDKSENIVFYASDYSDNLALEYLTDFHKEFVPFFEKFENVTMETRTKSANIKPILDIGFVPKNTEFAFSLNPQVIIDKYEKKTSNLQDRIDAINTLIQNWYRVGLRFLPLLEINNYYNVYSDFLDEIREKISLQKISSIEIGSLLYTKNDYKNIIKKESSDILYRLNEQDNLYIRAKMDFRENIYSLFKEKLWDVFICMDK